MREGFAISCLIVGVSHGHKCGVMYSFQDSFSVATAVHGFHVYKDIWEPTIGEVLSRESDSHDTFAVAVSVRPRWVRQPLVLG